MSTGRWVCRLDRGCADFIALLDQLHRAFAQAPVIAVICGNDSIHHARMVTAYLDERPCLELLYGARCGPDDDPVGRIWAAMKDYVANTVLTWPGRLRQVRVLFCAPLTRCWPPLPWTSLWLLPRYEQELRNGA